MMVSVALFSIVMLVGMSAIVTLVSNNKKAQALNSVITDLNFTLESMTRTIRTGRDYSCSASPHTDCSSGGSTFRVTDQNGKRVTYTLSSGKILRDGAALTSENVVIDTLRFYVLGAKSFAEGDRRQPRVVLVVSGVAGTGDTSTSFNVQTSVTQRLIDL